MKKALMAASAVFLFSVPAAHAQLIYEGELGEDNARIVNMETQEEMSVVASDPTTGARPADCPEGAFFIGEDPANDNREIATSCDTEEAFSIGGPDETGIEGAPAGARLLSENTFDEAGDAGESGPAMPGGDGSFTGDGDAGGDTGNAADGGSFSGDGDAGGDNPN